MRIFSKNGTSLSSTGALIAYSGAKTGRSPKDKRVVKNPSSENDIWWGPVKEMVILGTEYAGEMKKGVFTILNYLMPKRCLLSMHCSATADPATDRSSILFGLSGTGKTTLSADPKRFLIGDDEHVWSDDGIFNIEGGCYAKAIDLSEESEPDIFAALHFGALLENVVSDDEGNEVNFADTNLLNKEIG